MLYVIPITIPPNTAEADALQVPIELTAGTITRVMLHFPAGHLGLTHIYINDGLHQVWPANPDSAFTTSDEVITWVEEYELDTAPYELQAYAWNDDDTYEHTITVRIELTPAAVEQTITDQIKSLLGMGGS